MLRPELLRRISKLQLTPRSIGGLIAGTKKTTQPAAFQSTRTESPQSQAGTSLLQRGSESVNPLGRCWIIRQPLSEIWQKGSRWIDKIDGQLEQLHPDSKQRELLALRSVFPNESCLLDLETCGFAGSMVFLAGVISNHEGHLSLTQIFARDYSEEAALLYELWTITKLSSALITFNGKSFDWPVVMDRTILHRLQGCHWNSDAAVNQSDWLARLRPPIHVDLLHISRRLWKHQLPNCRLQTLEKVICHRHRTGDIPGREIPSAYRDFVQRSNEFAINDVLHHNALDLITLLQILLVAIKKSATAVP